MPSGRTGQATWVGLATVNIGSSMTSAAFSATWCEAQRDAPPESLDESKQVHANVRITQKPKLA